MKFASTYGHESCIPPWKYHKNICMVKNENVHQSKYQNMVILRPQIIYWTNVELGFPPVPGSDLWVCDDYDK